MMHRTDRRTLGLAARRHHPSKAKSAVNSGDGSCPLPSPPPGHTCGHPPPPPRAQSTALLLRPVCLLRLSSPPCLFPVADTHKHTPSDGLLRGSPSVGHETTPAVCSARPKSFRAAPLPRARVRELVEEPDSFACTKNATLSRNRRGKGQADGVGGGGGG